MFGVRIHFHSSLLILVVLICFLLIFIFYSRKKKHHKLKKIEINNDEDINLIDLFNHAFKLLYE